MFGCWISFGADLGDRKKGIRQEVEFGSQISILSFRTLGALIYSITVSFLRIPSDSVFGLITRIEAAWRRMH